jgi:hypothetical protein
MQQKQFSVNSSPATCCEKWSKETNISGIIFFPIIKDLMSLYIPSPSPSPSHFVTDG